MKVCFETFGCRLNRAESLQEEAVYLSRGWELTSSHEDADLIVLRGCSVTQRAQRDCEKLVEHIRKKYPYKRMLVTGCLPGAKENYFINGISSRRARDGEVAGVAVPTRTARAYLKVQDGCSGACTFCIVPRFRGKARSLPFDECLSHAQAFIDAGYHEIVVTGCNLSMYSSAGKSIADLLDALAGLSPDCRIRLGSLEPSSVAIKTVETIAAHDNLCNFIHIPVQSGSNRILAAMKRPYQTRLVEEIVHVATKLIPDIGLGCDIITGFPDESETDFLGTVGLLRRLPFNNIHAFPFSERPDTIAANLPKPVPQSLRSERARQVADLVNATRRGFAKSFVGKTVETVIENEQDLSGWTAGYLWCRIGEDKARVFTKDRGPTERRIRRKDLVKILVREVHHGVLTGDPV